MHHIFNVEDTTALNGLVWTELKKHGIKETGRWRKPTRNNDTQKKTIFSQPLELLDSEQSLIMVETEIENPSSESSQPVFAKGDILVQVPSFVVQSCQAILKSVHTEGLFRKAGSACRQREIKKQLEKGEGVKPIHDVVDLANILKQFLRELPEPLIPYQLHEILLKCVQMENSAKACKSLHLACLLIPPQALATLCYLLQFLEVVACNSSKNLMDASNLSIVMAPTLMPIHIAASSRNDRQNCAKLQCTAKVIQMLIENSSKLCGIPRCIASRLVSVSTTSLVDPDRGRRTSRDKRRHRRSSSFNRVFEGLRKIVGVKSEFSASAEHLSDCRSESATDLAPLTSPLVRSTIKRKVDGDINLGFSIKKKKSVTDILPQGRVLCTTPLTPQGNHRYEFQSADTHLSYFASPRIDLNPSPSGPSANLETNKSAVGVLRFFHRKKLAGRIEESCALTKTPKLTKRRLSLGKKSSKKSIAIDTKLDTDENLPLLPTPTSETSEAIDKPVAMKALSLPEPIDSIGENYDVVHQHYEELKCHVTTLESEIVHDLLQNHQSPEQVTTPVAMEVQNEYEKTLEESDKMLLERSASEHLARQLSRGLRIRRSAEQRVTRSPSARKIGAIRRRSRESPRASLNDSNMSGASRRLTRSQSMLAIRRNPSLLVQQMITPKRLIEPVHPITQEVKISLRRGKPNTIRTGLRDPTPMRVQSVNRCNKNRISAPDGETPRGSKQRMSPDKKDRMSSDVKSPTTPRRVIIRNGSVMKLAQNFAAITQTTTAAIITTPLTPVAPTTPEWSSGDILNRHLDHLRIPLTGRPSVQKIRSENVGKVFAHVRKFDRLASPTLPDAPPVVVEATPVVTHRSRTPKKSAPRHISEVRATPPKLTQISPLRESQRANALPHSVKAQDRYDVKIKAPLLTPSQATATPYGLRLRAHDVKQTRVQKKPSPLKATNPLLRRSPRFPQTPN